MKTTVTESGSCKKILEVEVPFEVIREIEVFIPDDYVVDLQKQKEKSDTQLKLERIARRALEKRYKTALTQAKIVHPKETVVVFVKKYPSWLVNSYYLLTMFSLTQILQWILL